MEINQLYKHKINHKIYKAIKIINLFSYDYYGIKSIIFQNTKKKKDTINISIENISKIFTKEAQDANKKV